eukprot:Lankesteria_metandrocarpae@DN5631_c0_g1_i1.p1
MGPHGALSYSINNYGAPQGVCRWYEPTADGRDPALPVSGGHLMGASASNRAVGGQVRPTSSNRVAGEMYSMRQSVPVHYSDNRPVASATTMQTENQERVDQHITLQEQRPVPAYYASQGVSSELNAAVYGGDASGAAHRHGTAATRLSDGCDSRGAESPRHRSVSNYEAHAQGAVATQPQHSAARLQQQPRSSVTEEHQQRRHQEYHTAAYSAKGHSESVSSVQGGSNALGLSWNSSTSSGTAAGGPSSVQLHSQPQWDDARRQSSVRQHSSGGEVVRGDHTTEDSTTQASVYRPSAFVAGDGAGSSNQHPSHQVDAYTNLHRRRASREAAMPATISFATSAEAQRRPAPDSSTRYYQHQHHQQQTTATTLASNATRSTHQSHHHQQVQQQAQHSVPPVHNMQHQYQLAQSSNNAAASSGQRSLHQNPFHDNVSIEDVQEDMRLQVDDQRPKNQNNDSANLTARPQYRRDPFAENFAASQGYPEKSQHTRLTAYNGNSTDTAANKETAGLRSSQELHHHQQQIHQHHQHQHHHQQHHHQQQHRHQHVSSETVAAGKQGATAAVAQQLRSSSHQILHQQQKQQPQLAPTAPQQQQRA